MPEQEFTAEVIQMCEDRGLLVHHCRDSRHCTGRGWVDLIIVSPCGNGILYVELKVWGDLSKEQVAWKWCLMANGADWRCWRPHEMAEIRTALDALAFECPQHPATGD
jgi:hypothetical protein